MNHLTQALRSFVDLFERRNVPYAVMGGLAVRVYGIPRATYDIDFTITLAREELPEVLRAAEGLGVSVPAPYFSGWLDNVAGMSLIKLHLFVEGRGVDIDIFLAENDFQNELMSRRRLEKLEDKPVALVSPEDLILLKVLASRPRDLADAGDVLFTQGQLDVAYLRHWGDRLQVRDALEKLIEEFYSAK